jgi:predicted kinase
MGHGRASACDDQLDTELVLIRGLPGSGKSTMAKVLALVGYEHYEADQFFLRDGVYEFDPARVRDAHAWCQAMTLSALVQGKRTVVSNTFTRLQELAPYQAMSRNVRIIEAKGRWCNVHKVPATTLQWMAERWEVLGT